MELTKILQKVLEIGGSDLFLIPGSPATAKVKGHLVPLTESKLLPEDTAGMIQEAYGMAGGHSDEMLRRDGDDDFSFSFNRQARFRCNAYKQRGTLAATCRVVTFGLPNPDALHIPPMVTDLASSCRNGMVLVTGPAGSGKSTTLACMVDRINADQDVHIITIEDPIEFVHQHKRCVMSQREVGTDTKSFAEALKRALREDPDIIEVGELRDLETISTALTAVETGHLVFATLHTQDAGSTVDRLIDVYPENQQQQIRVQVASTLRAVIVQTLIPRATGHGRAPATEVMINTPAVSSLIRSGKAHQIRTVLQSGEKEGMHTLDQDLARLVNKGVITFEDALVKVQVREEFEKLFGARKSC